MDINKAKDVVIHAGKELVKRGLIARTWGNVSQRVDENTMAITPSGKDYNSLTRDDIVMVDIDTLEYEGAIKPSSEKGVHASCYKEKDVNFVIHTHQEYASIISACNIAYIDVEKDFSLLDRKVLCGDYGLPSTKKLTKSVAKALMLTNGSCIIMKNHGAVCFGRDFEETFEAANQLEDACKEYLRKKYLEVSKESSFNEVSQAKFILKKYGRDAETFEAQKTKSAINRDNIIINDSLEAVVFSYLDKNLYPMVDDFAQIVGVKMRTVEDDRKDIEKALKKANAVFIKGCGAVCTGVTLDDAKAVSMIVEKNCKAFIGASLHGKVKPINFFESGLMNTIYKMKYSKQIDK